VVKWALILPVSVRQEIILSARQHARLCRQPRPGAGGSIVFAKPKVGGDRPSRRDGGSYPTARHGPGVV
jgi:hypothetical protein